MENKNIGKKGLVLSIANQKGGVGKTTLTILAAGLLNEIFKKNNYKFCVIDIDFQQSLSKHRAHDVLNHPEMDTSTLYPIYSHKDINTNSYLDINKFNKILSSYDVILFDLPGTLDFESSEEIYSKIDYIFTPVLTDDLTIISTLEYLKALDIMKQSPKYNLKDFKWFFNRYNSISFATYNEISEIFDEQYPDTYLGCNVVVSKEFETEKTTLKYYVKKKFHNPSNSLYNFISYIVDIVFKSRKEQTTKNNLKMN